MPSTLSSDFLLLHFLLKISNSHTFRFLFLFIYFFWWQSPLFKEEEIGNFWGSKSVEKSFFFFWLYFLRKINFLETHPMLFIILFYWRQVSTPTHTNRAKDHQGTICAGCACKPCVNSVQTLHWVSTNLLIPKANSSIETRSSLPPSANSSKRGKVKHPLWWQQKLFSHRVKGLFHVGTADLVYFFLYLPGLSTNIIALVRTDQLNGSSP